MLPRPKVAPEFAALWDRFCAHMRTVCADCDVAPSATYKPDAGGRGSWVLQPGARTVAQAWKVIDRMRRRGWAVRLVPGVAPSISVDLRIEPLDEET